MPTKLISPGLLLAIAIASSSALATSPYAGQESREIKALPESEAASLLAGQGMGLAKAAELNGYPGPAHVLELSSQLKLSESQVARTRELHARMDAEAKAAGRLLVDAESELDTLFRERKATPELLAQSLGKVASLQARVREVHLQAHLTQTLLLSAEQIAQYNQLRGYAQGVESRPPGEHHKRHQ